MHALSPSGRDEIPSFPYLLDVFHRSFLPPLPPQAREKGLRLRILNLDLRYSNESKAERGEERRGRGRGRGR